MLGPVATKKLRMSGEQTNKLGADTIMDRTLAAEHGAPYVHAAAFAIDVERVLQLDPDSEARPFGWEVLLTEAYLEHALQPAEVDSHRALLEGICLGVLDSKAKPPPLGSQIAFAVFAGVQRGALPKSLESCFANWKKPPVDFAREIAELWTREGLVQQLARHCLDAPLEPALVPPVKAALERLA